MKYKNAFHGNGYGPEYYETDAKPHDYGVYQLFNRIPGTVCDIVLNGVCVSQCVTVGGAKRHIESPFGKQRIAEVSGRAK